MPSVSAALAEYRARLGTTDESAERAAVRDAAAFLLQQELGPEGLRQAFGHAPGVIGATPPWAISLWVGSDSVTEAFSPTDGTYTGWAGGEEITTAPLDLIIAVGVLNANLPNLHTQAESWELPLRFFVSAYPSLGGAVLTLYWRGFEITGFTWGDTTYLVAVAHCAVDLLRKPPVPTA